MLITDTTRKGLAKYLADYVSTEVERSMKIEGFGAWDTGDMQQWIESGLEAYESIHQPKQYAISPGLHGLHLNGQQFLLSDNKKVRLFHSITEANEHGFAMGCPFNLCEYLPESGDYVLVE